MAIYQCTVCKAIYDEEMQGMRFEKLPDDWVCPICKAAKSKYIRLSPEALEAAARASSGVDQEGEKPPTITVSDLMVDTMINWGVTHVFGMVGHSNLGLADAVRRRCEAGNLAYIGIRHEGAAAFAASAFGKVTERPAACLTIAGPGATNLLTGLWDAKMDRVPILALTGQVDFQYLGPGAFQEIDLDAAFDTVACWSQTVLESSNHAELMNLAIKNAVVNRDVAHLIFPNKVQEHSIPGHIPPGSPEGRLTALDITPSPKMIDKAVGMIRSAERPVIIVGYGARSGIDTVIALAEQFHIPVITTFKAKGLIPDSHPLACGVLGRSGTPISGWFMSQSDLLMVFGASFSQHTGILKDRPIIQVDRDRMALGKFHPVATPIWGDVEVTAQLFLEQLEGRGAKTDFRPEVAERWEKWRAKKKEREQEDRGTGLNSALVFGAMNRHVPDDAIISVDVGNNTYSFGRYFECTAQSVVMSGYLGSIGFGYPGAIGAWAAAPNRPIVAVTGDGGFGQYMGEITTAVKYNMPIKHILLNNNELGKITNEQRDAGKQVWETTLVNPNFSQFAENCGALGVRVSEGTQLDEAMKLVFAHDGPALLEVIADPELT